MAEKRVQKQSRRGSPKVVEPPVVIASNSLRHVFENKAGRYELARIEGNMAYYNFTNHQGHTTDAVMPVLTWCRLQERVGDVHEPAPVSAA